MELIIELILDIFLEGTMEIAQEKKAPRVLRAVVLLVLTIVYSLFAAFLVYIAVESKDTIVFIIVGGVLLLILGVLIKFWWKFLRTCREIDYYRALGIKKISPYVEWEESIIAGLGIIDNDFHERKDLSPNVCALYVESSHRNKGLAKRLLDHARKEAAGMGFKEVYLITDHKDFYEKCGWEYFTDVKCDDGDVSRMYKAETKI